MSKIWYRTTGGAHVVVSGYPRPELPEGAEEITEAEYHAAVGELRAEREAAAEAERIALAEKQLADFQALLGLGIPEGLAGSLSGYTGPWPLPSP